MIKNTITKFLDIFKVTNDEEIVELNEENALLCIELSYSYISYEINNSSEIHIVQLDIQKYNNFDELLNIWVEAVHVIIESLKIKVDITFLIKSNDFIVKNSEKFIDKKIQNKYFANKLALEEDNIDVRHLFDKSYLIVEYRFLQKILFAFKEYKIINIYDMSILNSLNIKESEKHLYLDISLNSCDIILNYIKIQKRDLKINLADMIDKASSTMYIDFKSTYDSLKINFKNIKTYEELKNSKKPLKNELIEYIDSILENINNTLSYFSILENIDYIESIYINGDVLEFDFVIHILSDKLNINFVKADKYVKVNYKEKVNLTFLRNSSQEIIDKLNINFDGLNYNDGREEYVFIENKFTEKGTLSATQKAKTSKKKEKQEIKITNKNKSFFYDENEIPIWKMSMTELFEFMKNRFEYNNLTTYNNISSKKIFYFILSIPIFITFIYFFNIITDSQMEFNANVNNLENRIQRVDILKKELLVKNEEVNINSLSQGVDKIFWTQKLITIANLMPNEIWLSSLTMENQTKNIENKEVTKQIMVLESRSLPSAIGHISSIALYMDKLLHTKNDFKKDFSSINFGGANIQKEYGYDVVNFKLLCEFEKNINIKDIEKEARTTNDKSIGENLMNINKNKQVQKQILEEL